MPNLQAEILDDRGETTTSPLGQFDFRNFTYPLPRGWQHPDGDELVLVNGKLEPKFKDIQEEMSPEEKAAARAERRIGMSYVTTKYIDADNDGQDEAVVVLKVETGGNAIPQLVYIYAWKDGNNLNVTTNGIPVGFTTNGNHRDGYTVGGGLEYMFAPSWSAKIEYQYYNFGSSTFTAGPPVIVGTSFRDDEHTVKAGLNYRFNWGGPVVAKY